MKRLSELIVSSSRIWSKNENLKISRADGFYNETIHISQNCLSNFRQRVEEAFPYCKIGHLSSSSPMKDFADPQS